MCSRRNLTRSFILLLAVMALRLPQAPAALARGAPDNIRPEISQGELYVFPGILALLQSSHLEAGIEKRLDARLENARAAFNAPDQYGACDLLNAFIHEV